MAIHELQNNPQLKGQIQLLDNITYAAADGEPQKMAILLPWATTTAIKTAKRPLIVFVQGSSWRLPLLGRQIPQLVDFARAGYIVATVQHRNALDGHHFPAFLMDVKTAIRYLRANADKYDIDPQRVALWGTSSGANASLLAGLTPDDPRYRTDDYVNESDRVNAVVSCFGPTDVADTFDFTGKKPGSDILQYCLFGLDKQQWQQKKAAMSPVKQVQPGKEYPPFLLLHGDADKTVPYHEMEEMYHALEDNGASVEAYRVHGANHEADFWSPAVYDVIREFLNGIEKPNVK